MAKDNTVNRLNIRVRLWSHQENWLKFPPQDANSNEVIYFIIFGYGMNICRYVLYFRRPLTILAFFFKLIYVYELHEFNPWSQGNTWMNGDMPKSGALHMWAGKQLQRDWVPREDDQQSIYAVQSASLYPAFLTPHAQTSRVRCSSTGE